MAAAARGHADAGARLLDAGLRAEVNLRDDRVGYKIREAQMMKTPYMLIIGDREMEEGTVTVRKRNGDNLPPMTPQEFADLVRKECEQGTA